MVIKRWVVWNVYVNHDPKDVAKGLEYIREQHDPDIFVLQEASKQIAMLRIFCKAHGYRLLVGKKKPGIEGQESRSTVQLVHNRVPLLRWHAWKMKNRWKGPKRGLNRPGRTFITSVFPGERTTAGHMVTGRKHRNRTAWEETWTKMLNKAKKWGAEPAIWLMDYNDYWGNKDAYSMQAFAKKVGGKVFHDESRIDYVVARGMTVKVETRKFLGSDHQYFTVDRLS